MTSHTPGPWTMGPLAGERIGKHYVDSIPISARGLLIARVWTGSSGLRQDGPANARIIVASPDMLQALHQLYTLRISIRPIIRAKLSTQEKIEEAFKAAGLAIDKATLP